MKRSEMVKRLQDRFNTTDVDAIADLADEVIGFLEQQGMRPPPYAVRIEHPSTVIGDRYRSKTIHPVYRYEIFGKEGWEPEDEE